MPVDFKNLPVRILHGVGVVARTGEEVSKLGKRPLVVTDPGIVAAGHVDAVRAMIEDAGLAVAVFDQVHENPTERDVLACVEAARAHRADLLIGLGGGSSMDAAKGCNFLFTNGGRMSDYRGTEKATRPMLPFVAIPTTAGTGSECQRYALISDPETHEKMACGDTKTRAKVAILDPALTVTQPPFVAACTGIDAVAHAVESGVTKAATDSSLALAREAFGLLQHHLPTVMREPGNLDARAAMQIGAALAGSAIEQSMLGAAHSAANPLTARFDVVHGQAVGILLPWIVEYNAEDAEARERYRALAEAAGLLEPGDGPDQAPARIIQRLRELLEITGLAKAVSAFGVDDSDVPRLSEEAAGQWTAQFNPRAIGAREFAEIYRKAMN